MHILSFISKQLMLVLFIPHIHWKKKCGSVIPHKSCQSVEWLSNRLTCSKFSFHFPWLRDIPLRRNTEYAMSYKVRFQNITLIFTWSFRSFIYINAQTCSCIYILYHFLGAFKRVPILNTESLNVTGKNTHGSIRSYWAPLILLLFVLGIFMQFINRNKHT